MKKIRCAIYTRKSTEENLDANFNSLDAQREAAENYIKSQCHKGWVILPQRYDDGGFSGGNMKRPGLIQLQEDVKAGKVDVIVVYKIDRLSRSLLDFSSLLTVLEEHNVAFVSVTQDINTSTSSGRLMLNILMTFAQYEREVIAERIRDKMSASRRKGLWVGGSIPFGYKSINKQLIVVPAEAEIVRMIFDKFLATHSPKAVCMDLNDAGKRRRDGKEWLLSHIYRILHNYTYIGQVRYKGNIYDGEQEAIISKEVWDKAQEMLKEADPLKGTRLTSRQETVVLLRDLVRCGHCGCAMGSNYTRKKNNRKYVYYICIQDTKKARKTCPVGRVSGGDLEQVVLEQIQRLLLTPQVQAQLICDDLDADTVKRYTSQFSEIWQEIFPVAQYQILHLLVEKITVFEDHLDVELKTSYLKDLIKDLKNGTN